MTQKSNHRRLTQLELQVTRLSIAVSALISKGLLKQEDLEEEFKRIASPPPKE